MREENIPLVRSNGFEIRDEPAGGGELSLLEYHAFVPSGGSNNNIAGRRQQWC
jgi:hypothetical protein